MQIKPELKWASRRQLMKLIYKNKYIQLYKSIFLFIAYFMSLLARISQIYCSVSVSLKNEPVNCST